MAKRETTTEIQSVQTWESDSFGSVRTVMQDDEPWFVARDVAKILGYKTAKDMYRNLDEDEKGGANSAYPWGKSKAHCNQ